MEHRINERYAYTEARDVQGRTFYELWDYSRLHGRGSLRGPTCVRTSYDLSEVISITNPNKAHEQEAAQRAARNQRASVIYPR